MIKHNIVKMTGILGLLTLSHAVWAQDKDSIEQRLDALEAEQRESLVKELDDTGIVKTFLQDKVRLGGFYENGITGLYGATTPSEVSANSFSLGLNVAADIDPQFRFVGQLLNLVAFPLQNPNADPRASIGQRSFKFSAATVLSVSAHAYTEYRGSEAFSLQTGLGYAPFGIAFQQRELVLFERRGGPQLISNVINGGAYLASPLWEGVHVLGSFPGLGRGRFGYDAYSMIPGSNVSTLGIGTRLWYSPGKELTFGVSQQWGQLLNDTLETYGLDVKWTKGFFSVTSEYARNILTSDTSSPTTFYVEPSYSFFNGKLVVYLAADYLDNPANVTAVGATSVPDPVSLWKLGGGINYLPHPSMRFRFGYLYNTYVGPNALASGQTRDYASLDLSAGIAF